MLSRKYTILLCVSKIHSLSKMNEFVAEVDRESELRSVDRHEGQTRAAAGLCRSGESAAV